MSHDQPVSFETAVERLAGIVESLDRGQLTLEDSLARFEEGVNLLRYCRSVLDRAECRIQEFVEFDDDGNARLKPFDHEATFDPTSKNSPTATTPRKPKRKRSSQESTDTGPVAESNFAGEKTNEDDLGLF